jgi:hypothetical protein
MHIPESLVCFVAMHSVTTRNFNSLKALPVTGLPVVRVSCQTHAALLLWLWYGQIKRRSLRLTVVTAVNILLSWHMERDCICVGGRLLFLYQTNRILSCYVTLLFWRYHRHQYKTVPKLYSIVIENRMRSIKTRTIFRSECCVYSILCWGLQTTARGPDMPGIRPAIVYFDYIVKFTM